MQHKTFSKLDEGFICQNCGKKVEPLGYTSRDHCPYCLCSLHVDVCPGDRQNECQGLMQPTNIEYNSKKGYVIVYKCTKCKQTHKNKAAEDDDMDKIMEIMKNA